jgi:hypothetical protein
MMSLRPLGWFFSINWLDWKFWAVKLAWVKRNVRQVWPLDLAAPFLESTTKPRRRLPRIKRMRMDSAIKGIVVGLAKS